MTQIYEKKNIILLGNKKVCFIEESKSVYGEVICITQTLSKKTKRRELNT